MLMCECSIKHTSVHTGTHTHTHTHTHVLRLLVRAVGSAHFRAPLLLFDASWTRSSSHPSLAGQWPQSPCFDWGTSFFEATSPVVESYQSFRTCKLICFEQQTSKKKERKKSLLLSLRADLSKMPAPVSSLSQACVRLSPSSRPSVPERI